MTPATALSRSRPRRAPPLVAGHPSAAAALDTYRHFGASRAVATELLAYEGVSDGRAGSPAPAAVPLPMPDEEGVARWAVVVERAHTAGAVEALRGHLMQLRFPIAAGTSRTAAYVAATRGGAAAFAPRTGATFAEPDRVRVALHGTAAGQIAVIRAARADFETLVRALVYANEPVPVPAAMGACIVGGYVSRTAPRKAHGDPGPGPGPERFILLADGPYSGVPAARLGLHHDAWLETSNHIRLEHECGHYVARRAFGRMRGRLSDELAADYVGLIAACGRFEAPWQLRFMGVDARGRLVSGGRLQNYRGDPPLGMPAVRVLARLLRAAAEALTTFDPYAPAGIAALADHAEGWVRGPLGLAGLGLCVLHTGAVRLAAPGGAAALAESWARFAVRHTVGHLDRTGARTANA